MLRRKACPFGHRAQAAIEQASRVQGRGLSVVRGPLTAQESGRAGRDGLPARSVLFYGAADRDRMEWILQKEASRQEASAAGAASGGRLLPACLPAGASGCSASLIAATSCFGTWHRSG